MANNNDISLKSLILLIQARTIKPVLFDNIDQARTDWSSFLKRTNRLLSQHDFKTCSGLEDDILRQNPNRSRSIIEIVSNSIDSDATTIQADVKDGSYSISDNGHGMSLETFFSAYLLPKGSTKAESDTIGRFGIGAYTALAHLLDENSRVTVESKSKDHPGFRAIFKKADGKIVIHIEDAPQIQKQGTRTTVNSTDILQQAYQAALQEHAAHFHTFPIHVNREQINVPQQGLETRLINTPKLGLRWTNKQTSKPKTLITIGGIKIQEVTCSNNSFCGVAVWEFPRTTIISESRNCISVTKDETRQLIFECINYVDIIQNTKEKIRYLNTITPLVRTLQQHNSSTKQSDHLLVPLIQKAKSICTDISLAPDLALFHPLCNDSIVPIDGYLLKHMQPNWMEKAGERVLEWNGKTSIYKADINQAFPGYSGLIHNPRGEFPDIVFIDSKIIEKIPKDTIPYKLSAILGLPPGEIQGSACFHEKAAVVSHQASKVTITKKKGCLDEDVDRSSLTDKHPYLPLSEAKQKTITPEHTAIFCEAPILSFLKVFSTEMMELKKIIYKNKTYFIGILHSSGVDDPYLLFDTVFSARYDIEAQMIVQKLKQLFCEFELIPNLYPLEIDENDRFIISVNGNNIVCNYKLEPDTRVQLKPGEKATVQYSFQDGRLLLLLQSDSLCYSEKGILKIKLPKAYAHHLAEILRSTPKEKVIQVVEAFYQDVIASTHLGWERLVGPKGYCLTYSTDQGRSRVSVEHSIKLYDIRNGTELTSCTFKNGTPLFGRMCEYHLNLLIDSKDTLLVLIRYDEYIPTALLYDKKEKKGFILNMNHIIGDPIVAFVHKNVLFVRNNQKHPATYAPIEENVKESYLTGNTLCVTSENAENENLIIFKTGLVCRYNLQLKKGERIFSAKKAGDYLLLQVRSTHLHQHRLAIFVSDPQYRLLYTSSTRASYVLDSLVFY